MKTNSGQNLLWPAELAARLRLLQATLADEPAADRGVALAAAVEGALQTLPADERAECLAAVMEEFSGPESSPAAEAATVADDALGLASRLAALAPQMSPDETERVVARLARARLTPEAGGGEIKVPEELAARIEKLMPGQKLDSRRALRLLDVLIEISLSMDQLVWTVWRTVAPKSMIHRDGGPYGELRKAVGAYLTGDPEVSTEQVRQNIEKNRKLVAGLIGALGMVGDTYSALLLERLSPDAIRKAAEAEPGVFESIEKKCWRKYLGAFGELNGAALEKDVRTSVKKYTEKLILGADAASDLDN